MDVNATLIIQMLIFVVFVWITMKFIWPPLMKTLEARRKIIADGLAASEEAKESLRLAEVKATEQLLIAKTEAAKIVEQANQRATHLIEEAKGKAKTESEHILQLAQAEIAKEYHAAKEKLLKQVSAIAVAGAERILQHEVDKASNDRLVDELVSEM